MLLTSEWAVNIQRDSYASYIGHYPMLAYFAIAENESIGRERYNFMQVFSPSSFLLTIKCVLCVCLFCFGLLSALTDWTTFHVWIMIIGLAIQR